MYRPSRCRPNTPNRTRGPNPCSSVSLRNRAGFGEPAGLGREVTQSPVSPPVAILSRPDEVRARIQQLNGSIALDTEFHAEARFQPELMWVQLADSRGECLVIDAQIEGSTLALIQALENRDLLLHAGVHDLRILAQYAEVRPRSVFEIGRAHV